ncbi:hypothetical protein C7S16_5034 [Burkholderia thailandensis]|uniref:Uncharacterized protein n=1 Tax=Burkholderia thailandensis TaxID=57975 RepID=A0AAW9D023_BURTH|nr:hypothetical protein [Burkholderia thailandensis]
MDRHERIAASCDRDGPCKKAGGGANERAAIRRTPLRRRRQNE